MFELSKSLVPLTDKIIFVCHTRIKSLFHFLLLQPMIIYHSYLWFKLYLGFLTITSHMIMNWQMLVQIEVKPYSKYNQQSRHI